MNADEIKTGEDKIKEFQTTYDRIITVKITKKIENATILYKKIYYDEAQSELKTAYDLAEGEEHLRRRIEQFNQKIEKVKKYKLLLIILKFAGILYEKLKPIVKMVSIAFYKHTKKIVYAVGLLIEKLSKKYYMKYIRKTGSSDTNNQQNLSTQKPYWIGSFSILAFIYIFILLVIFINNEITISQKTNALYSKAVQYINNDNLTTPPGKCAYKIAEMIFSIDDTDNSLGLKIINDIVSKYKSWAQINENKQNYERALHFIWKALSVDTNNNTLKASARRLEKLVLRQDKENMVFISSGLLRISNTDRSSPSMRTIRVDDFYLSKYEVTVGFFHRFIRKSGYMINPTLDLKGTIWDGSKIRMEANTTWDNPNYTINDSLPVTLVRWIDAIEFCNWLSLKHGFIQCYKIKNNEVLCDFTSDGYRLPTSAEWVFAAQERHKNKLFKYSGSKNVKDVSWYSTNSTIGPHKISQKLPNKLGVFDMSGNVWEWCWDWYGRKLEDVSNNSIEIAPKNKYKVIRGGSWSNLSKSLKVNSFEFGAPNQFTNYIGFRVARTADKKNINQ